ncbi:MAG: hypothetical protein Ta2F_16390 [Termitinemataceae bacterium]|nr:MAG: hypothetical protein Ta2F_16390 [Termitinemataceae bacterium]
MQLSLNTAFILSAAMGFVIFFCRLFPFIFFKNTMADNTEVDRIDRNRTDRNKIDRNKIDRNKIDSGGIGTKKFFKFVEKTAPPVAMTVLTFNEIAHSIKSVIVSELSTPSNSVNTSSMFVNMIYGSEPVIIACVVTAGMHIIKRNPLISIFSGTIVFMILR